MNFSPAFLDEIRARLPISQIVGQTVKLIKSGREWRGFSPFNKEKTPSFFVNDQKGRFFDFSAGRDGDIFEFLIATEGISFPEAVERLAALAGISLPSQDPKFAEKIKQRGDLHDVLSRAQEFFEQHLHASGAGIPRAYLNKRGLDMATIKDFQLGFAPDDRFALRNHLAAQSISLEQMIGAGLLIHGADIAVPYDRFRNRIMFPIHDSNGHIIAFGGRALEKDASAKYLNSPETELFHKGSVLYNHHRAKIAAHKSGKIYVVEGYIDVISMTMAGLSQTLAPLGTALTGEQCQLLWRLSNNPILCFDGDKAGRRAAYRAIDTALPLLGADRSLQFVLLPEGSDPDDILRQSGTEELKKTVAKPIALNELLWQREWELTPLDTPEQRLGFERRLFALLQNLQDLDLRKLYQQDYKARLMQLFAPPQRPKRRGTQPTYYSSERSFNTRGASPRPLSISPGLARSPLFSNDSAAFSQREALICLILINHPPLIADHSEALVNLPFRDVGLRKLVNTLIGMAGDHFLDHTELVKLLKANGFARLLERLEHYALISTLSSVRPAATIADAGAVLQQAISLHHAVRTLYPSMQHTADALGRSLADGDVDDRSWAQLCDLRHQLSEKPDVDANDLDPAEVMEPKTNPFSRVG